MMLHSYLKKKEKAKALLPEQLVHLVLLHFSETQSEPSALPPPDKKPAPTHLHTNMSH